MCSESWHSCTPSSEKWGERAFQGESCQRPPSVSTAIKGRDLADLSFNSVCSDKNLFSRPHQSYFIIEECVPVFGVGRGKCKESSFPPPNLGVGEVYDYNYVYPIFNNMI